MIFTGYFKTENLFVGSNKFTFTNTSINPSSTVKNRYLTLNGELDNEFVDSLDTTLYFQNEDDPDTSYKVLNTTASDGSEVEYSGTDTSTPIYSAITDDTIFTSNQNFGDHQINWEIKYMGKATGIPRGENAHLDFKFYKVNSSDVETLLFTLRGNISEFYYINAFTATGIPSGSVTTTDRLLIKVFFGSSLPS